jgi:hypothetical protein
MVSIGLHRPGSEYGILEMARSVVSLETVEVGNQYSIA